MKNDSTQQPPQKPEEDKKIEKRHAIRPKWLRVTLKVLMWVLIVILAIPALLYVPPVQTAVTRLACDVVRSKTGMNIGIERFRLKFPLNVTLDGVQVIEATGDTMATVRTADIGVKLMPLLKMDLRVDRLKLTGGSYRMVSPDSSMILKIKAGELMADDRTRVNLKNMDITLGDARLRDGSVNLYMDVWKKKPSPDTASNPMVIKAARLKLENFTFAMSMLPTIDTLRLAIRDLELEKGVVDLGKSRITASRLMAAGGDVTYLTPTPEFVKTHPVPVDSVTPPSPPMVIEGDSVSLDDFKVLYAMKGAKPLPGFDASYISLTDVCAGVRGFYNAASTLRIPVTRLQARERSGLQVTEATGRFNIDADGMALEGMTVHTPFSTLSVTAGLPFALMELKPDAPLNVQADASVGLPDINAFMPALKEYTSLMPRRSPVNLKLIASGKLGDADIERFDAAVPGVVSLRATGTATNALDFKKLKAALKFEGDVADPKVAGRLARLTDIPLPTMRIKGSATADRQNYGADFRLLTSEGNVTAKGSVGLNSERYHADVEIDRFNVAPFAPTAGIGRVTARITANGAGFNPERRGAATDITLDLASAEYRKTMLRDLKARIGLHDGEFSIDAESRNPMCDFAINGHGRVAPDNYDVNLAADLRHIDLRALGLTDTVCNGMARFNLAGTASPRAWLYDLKLDMADLDWNFGETKYTAPGGVEATVVSTPVNTLVALAGDEVSMTFESPFNMKHVADKFSAIAASIPPQLAKHRIDMKALQDSLPMFRLRAAANDRGLLAGFLKPSGIKMDTLWVDLGKDTIVKGRIQTLNLATGSIAIDTIDLRLKQRGELMDYKLHAGNRKGTLDEFAKVDINGYLGTNRIGMMLNQYNIQGEQGYRLGLTAAIADSTVTVHFTPLKATIGYMPWKFNLDNHIDFNLLTRHLNANLQAQSNESSILLKSEDVPGYEGNSVHLNLDNIKIEQFLNIMVDAPPLTGTLNSDIRLKYDGKSLEGNGSMQLDQLVYNTHRVGDFDMTLDAGYDAEGTTRLSVGLNVDKKPALAIHSELLPDSGKLEPKNTFLSLMEFPLDKANPFLGNDVGRLSGTVSGRMDLTGTFSQPVLDGQMACDSAGVYVAMLGTTLHLDDNPITVRGNVLQFNKFHILAANRNPLVIDGTVDASKLTDVRLNMAMNANNFQLIGNDRRAGSDIYGKLFINLDASARGPLSHFDINANLNVLGNTDVTYRVQSAGNEIAAQQKQGVVKFVNFSDTTQVAAADTLPARIGMRINATATLTPGCQATVLMNSDAGNVTAQLNPSGTLTYFQNYMGDMRLNGTLTLGEGFAKGNIKLIGEKKFDFDPKSSVTWNGQMMNPILNIHATDEIKASVNTGSTTNLVNFLVGLNATGQLSAPKVQFDLSTDDDMTIHNQLQSMSPDQRSQQAINLMLTGQYTAPGAKTVSSNLVTGQLYSLLTSQLNSWAAQNIRGVDLSFGVDQYESGTNGRTETTTSYSYQVSKSLFNNRFKIIVGGNYSTDASADENFAENLISDVSFEYILRQTTSTTLSAKLFRHMGFENILEGEITETGLGLVMKRRLSNLKSLFRILGRKRKPEPADSVPKELSDSTAVKDAEPGTEENPVNITRKTTEK